MKVLITGGAGFIGARTAAACAAIGLDVVILDRNAAFADHRESHARYAGDVRDASTMDQVLGEHPDISVVLHAAANPSVTAATTDPLATYDANVGATVSLLSRVRDAGISRVVFSSSVAVYASGRAGRAREDEPPDPSGVYACSKAMAERVLADAADATGPRAIVLRYANPMGPTPDRTGRSGSSAPRTVLEQILSAQRTGNRFAIAGGDWPTEDGSAVRDFLHVDDVADANVAAIVRFDEILESQSGFDIINVGRGRGTTVRELVHSVERVTGAPVDVAVSPRRPGERMGRIPDVGRALRLLRWESTRSIDDAVRDCLDAERR